MYKKITAVALISILTVNSANAGINGALDTMFLSNSTNPTSINTADRNGFMMGGASIHVPVTQINLISFDPPRFNMGCGGIDLYLGSFSFINSQALVALFKQIVANAAAALFYTAIQGISAQLGDVMSKFQKIVGDLNNMFRNSCAAGTSGMANMQSAWSSLAQDSGSLITSASSMISDFGAGQNATPNQVATQNTQSNQPAGAGANPSMQTTPANPELGNYVWKFFAVTKPEANLSQSIGTSATLPVVQRELLMSFSGTEINVPGNTATSNNTTTNAASNPSGNQSGGGATSTGAQYPATLNFNDIMNGSGSSAPPGAPTQPLLACNDDSNGTVMPDSNTGCQQLDLTRSWDFEGTRSLVQKLLFGTSAGTTTVDSAGLTVPSGTAGPDLTAYSNGIIYMITHCPSASLTAISSSSTATCGMSATQLAFLNSINAPLQSDIMHLQVLGNGSYGTTWAPLFGTILDAIAREYAIKLASAIYAAINSGISGTAIMAAKMPPSVTVSLKNLNDAITVASSDKARDMSEIQTLQIMLDEMLKNNPNAIDVGF